MASSLLRRVAGRPCSVVARPFVGLAAVRSPLAASPSPVLPAAVQTRTLTTAGALSFRFGSSVRLSGGGDPHDDHHGGTDFLSVENVERRVRKVFAEIEKVDKTKLKDLNTSFKQLGLDSLDEVEAVIMLEDEFVIDIQDEVASNILTLQDAVNYITNHPFAATDELHH